MMFMSCRRFNGGAGEGNRTLVISLEGCCSTIELHPRETYKMKMVEEAGFEPAYAKRTDLQSVSFNHSDTPPSFIFLSLRTGLSRKARQVAVSS